LAKGGRAVDGARRFCDRSPRLKGSSHLAFALGAIGHHRDVPFSVAAEAAPTQARTARFCRGRAVDGARRFRDRSPRLKGSSHLAFALGAIGHHRGVPFSVAAEAAPAQARTARFCRSGFSRDRTMKRSRWQNAHGRRGIHASGALVSPHRQGRGLPLRRHWRLSVATGRS